MLRLMIPPGPGILVVLMMPLSGVPPEIIAACVTPGMRLICSTTSANAGPESAGAVRDSMRGEICAVNTRSGLKPGSIRRSDTKLPMNSAAPTRRTTASATSATTSAPRSRRRPEPALLRAPSFKAVDRSGLDS